MDRNTISAFMARNILYLIASVFIALYACDAPKNQTAKPAPVATGPSTSDLLDVLQGRWRNLQDTSYLIDISDDLMTHYKGKAAPEGYSIEVYNDCPATMCHVDSLTASNGWCFIEKSEQGNNCFQVLTCDTASLRFILLGGSGDTLSFKKI